MTNIKKNPTTGKWETRVSLGFDERGKRIQRFKRADTKRELEYWMANLLKEREDGSIKRRKTKMKVADLIAVYYERRAPQLAKATLYNRRKISGLLEKELGKMLLENVRTHHLADVMMKYAELRDWNANSYNTMLQQVRAFFRYAVEMEYLKEDPSAGLAQDRRRAVKNHQVWSQEECELFIETHEKELRALPIILILHTGMRIGEAITLRWSDIDFEERKVLVKRSVSDHNRSAHQNEKAPKNGLSRLIVLSDAAVDYLKSMKRVQASHQLSKGYRNDEDYVCLNTLGRPFSATIVHRSFNWLTELAGVPRIRIHDLRHTHATLLLEQGVHPKVVQERLGHASYTITMDLYSHVSVKLHHEAAEMLVFKKSVQ
ncbi:tyrosine-type recombinase/integrase [Exiguobacterium acetylicum]|uniref:tyrosine-type recombinase/integrase n=1 Tax=Exiguobacterium acetylicum TaxID=41170 RepID=UPI001EE1CCA2|nr:tyrosine-type recombinase/integrase [Exiguobacterium acetylicum]UKS54912.1 site-specific integrase [Exiguobacterium acetylicum]